MVIGRFLLGAGLGGLVGGGLLVLASVLSPVRPMPPLAGPGTAPEAPAPAAPEAAEPQAIAQPAPEAGADVAPEAASEPAAQTPPLTEPSAAPEAAPEKAPETAPPSPAEPALPEAAADAPLPEPEPAPAAPGAEAPVAPQSPAPAPAPRAPDLAEGPTPAAPSAPAAPAAPGDDAAPVAPAQPAPALALPAEPAAPAAPAAPETDAAAPADEAAVPVAPADPSVPAPAEAEAAPAAVEPPGLPPLTPEEEAMLAEIAKNGPGSALPPGELPPELVPPAAPPEAAPESAPEAAGLPPDTATPATDDKRIVVGEGSTLPATPPLPGAGEAAVVEDRLPRIGADPAPAPEPAPEPSGDGAADPAAAPADGRPLARNARPFENPAEKPLFTVILIDNGDPALDRAALADLPFPVSFALDPLSPEAAAQAQIYRDAGQEVLMLATGLPQGAQASDVEVAFQAMFQALPQAVAVMAPQQGGFQGDRPIATLVVPVVGAEGLGLVTWDQGLNAADQVARREDVPAAVAFRALDAEGEAAPVIRRYLDRAAFKAAQEGRVTVVGTTRPETVAALLEWSVEGRAATVALAPVSAVLTLD